MRKLEIQARRPSSEVLLAWHITSIFAICVLVATGMRLLIQARLGLESLPFSAIPRPDEKAILLGALLGCATYFMGALITLYRWHSTTRSVWGIADFALLFAPLGLALLGLVLFGIHAPRLAVAVAFAWVMVILPLPYLLPSSWHRLAIVALVAIALSAFALQLHEEVTVLRGSPPSTTAARTSIKTEYYTLIQETYRSLVPVPAINGGGLARLGDDLLLVTGDGQFYFVHGNKRGGKLDATLLRYRAPINGEDFARSAGQPWRTPTGDTTPDEGRTKLENLHPEWFRVNGLLVQELDRNVRIFVSHMFWYPAQKCWVDRVSTLEGRWVDILEGNLQANWRTIFESKPCLPATGPDRRHGIPVVGYFGGGRMALVDEDHFLLTVGDYGFDGVASPWAVSQDPKVSYGKTLRIRISDGEQSTFTIGHRNPEGLYITQRGAVWSSEHGPQGGDELNRLESGRNYGWPRSTLGTDYGSFEWPGNDNGAGPGDFAPPAFAWVPSIGVSALIGIEGGLFPKWKDDLLVASLKAGSLFRTRIQDDHVVYTEPIPLGCRIRDIVEMHSGRLMIWSDDCGIVSLSPQSISTAESKFNEYCGGCHQASLIGGSRIGPSLHGVMNRHAASLEGYPNYSVCLRNSSVVWTRDALDRFIANPNEFCPGTAMDFKGVASSRDRAAIVDFLEGATK